MPEANLRGLDFGRIWTRTKQVWYIQDGGLTTAVAGEFFCENREWQGVFNDEVGAASINERSCGDFLDDFMSWLRLHKDAGGRFAPRKQNERGSSPGE
ncbi:unnamed protein product [Calypogeia fissa]